LRSARLPAGVAAAACAAAWSCLAATAPPAPSTLSRAELRADKVFATYAYAHEFGSGIYDFGGRTLQVYSIPFSWTARAAAPGKPGVRLRLPVTLGFLDFYPGDVITTGLPERVDSTSVVPGVQLEFAVDEHWTVLPYVQAGAAFANESEVDTRLFGAGARIERDFLMREYAGLYAAEAIYSSVRYRGELPDDDFIRVRNSVELRRTSPGARVFGRSLELAPFTVVDVYLDPPSGPVTQLDVPEVQIEAGLVFGTQPQWRPWGLPALRLGLSYRYAGDLSSTKLVIGAPF
jgi:hypothetical protein